MLQQNTLLSSEMEIASVLSLVSIQPHGGQTGVSNQSSGQAILPPRLPDVCEKNIFCLFYSSASGKQHIIGRRQDMFDFTISFQCLTLIFRICIVFYLIEILFSPQINQKMSRGAPAGEWKQTNIYKGSKKHSDVNKNWLGSLSISDRCQTLIDWVSNESVGFPAFNFPACVINFVVASFHLKYRSVPRVSFYRQLQTSWLDMFRQFVWVVVWVVLFWQS